MSTRGIQYIVDNASAIEVSRAKTIGQIVVRSGRIRTAERASTVPWQMVVTPPGASRFEDVRDVIEGITLTDRNRVFWVGFDSNPGLNYITEYKGGLNTTQLDALRITTSTGYLGNASFDVSDALNYASTATFDYMRLTNLPAIGSTTTNTSTFVTSSTVIFKAGDWVQFKTTTDGTIVRGAARTVPLDVLRGTGDTVDVPVHRPWIFDGSTTYSNNDREGAALYIGKDVQIRFVMTKMPSWRLVPGKLVQWTGDFELFEYIGN
jgi:hypothetical protein